MLFAKSESNPRLLAHAVRSPWPAAAVDLALVDITTNKILDMGACFDYFHEISHITATEQQIGKIPYKNRNILSDAMQRFNFIPYEKEFWHFDFTIHEIQHPIDIPIDNKLKNLNVDELI
jgi:D-alanyl-D-alanine dipeptidase